MVRAVQQNYGLIKEDADWEFEALQMPTLEEIRNTPFLINNKYEYNEKQYIPLLTRDLTWRKKVGQLANSGPK